jgi:ABC transporter substrate binding protein (PQQ-dependent alcohol dehydrogenase system)
MIKRLLQMCIVALLLAALPAAAERLRIGYLELAEDPRYAERTAYARIQLRANSRPLPGAQVAIEEADMIGRVIDTRFALEHHRGTSLDDLLATLERWAQEDIRLVLLDLPADAAAALAAKTRGQDLLLFNLSAPEDGLRRDQCQPHLMHAIPSHAMQMDALVQYLVAKDWRDLLVLQGPLSADAALVAALERSAGRFGAKVVAVRPFELGNDPRRRERNNIPLLTAGESYDAVVVADSEGEFGRYVPYQTKAARPVVGTTGLVPVAWSWVWERHGAPQVNDRFQQHVGRHMSERDWAAWVAVKAIVQSALRTQGAAFPELVAFLRSDKLKLDGAKGPALNFRAWNNQLRQPILLSTHDAMIARAPIEGFLHPRNTLDTLGDDAAESRCRLSAKAQAND